MYKKILFIFAALLLFNGCGSNNIKEEKPKEMKQDDYKLYTMDDERTIFFLYDVPDYSNEGIISKVRVEMNSKKIRFTDFINNLEYNSTQKDGTSKIFKYEKSKELYGDIDFYVLVCDTKDGIDDVYITNEKESLTEKCKKREPVRMELEKIKDNIIDKMIKLNYNNWSTIDVNEDNMIVVGLVDNSEKEQLWFKENVYNSKYLILEQRERIKLYPSKSEYENIEKLPHDYSIEDAVKNNNVVITNGRIMNPDTLDEFTTKLHKHEPSNLRLVTVTIEGNLIITDIKSDGYGAEIVIDNTRDSFEKGKITQKKYKHIEDTLDLSHDPAINRLIVYNDNINAGSVLYERERIIN